MACLVHPNGWRLYHRRFWNSTTFLDKRYQPAFNFLNKVLFEIIYSLFSYVKYRLRHKSFLGFSGFNTTMGNGQIININIHFKIYWRTYYTETSVAVHKVNKQSLQFLKKTWGPRRKRVNYWIFKKRWHKKKPYIKKIHVNKTKKVKKVNKLTILFRQSLIYRLRKRKYFRFKKKKWRRIKLRPVHLRMFEQKEAHVFIKKFFIYFTLLPLFYQYKNYLLKSIKTQIPSNNFKFNIFFIGHSMNRFNPMDVLRYVSFLLYKKRFSPTKTFYSILRVMLNLKRKLKLRGFKFLLAGRFTRRGRSVYKWRTHGGINLSSKYSSVDFYSFPLQGQYSKCIAKLWVCRA